MKQHSFIGVVVILVCDLFLSVCVSLSQFLIHHLLDLQDNFREILLKSRTDIYDIKYEARSFIHIYQNNVIIQYVYVNLFWTSISILEESNITNVECIWCVLPWWHCIDWKHHLRFLRPCAPELCFASVTKKTKTVITQPKQTGAWYSQEIQVFMFVPLLQQIETLYHPRPGRSKLCPDWCSGTSGMGWHLCVQITGFKWNENIQIQAGAVLWERHSPCCPPSSLSMPLMSLWRCP